MGRQGFGERKERRLLLCRFRCAIAVAVGLAPDHAKSTSVAAHGHPAGKIERFSVDLRKAHPQRLSMHSVDLALYERGETRGLLGASRIKLNRRIVPPRRGNAARLSDIARIASGNTRYSADRAWKHAI